MSIIKIQNVRRLDNAVNYITKDTKTVEKLISTFGCDRTSVVENFEQILNKRKLAHDRNAELKTKMIIQSFGEKDNVTPKIAHEAGKEFAKNYLKENHQYILTTHLDGKHIHNHIIFNQIRLDNFLMFDTKRTNTIDNLRLQNDNVSRKFDLYIPKERSHENKIHYMSQRELTVRKKGNSFKEEIENTIDEVIEVAKDYDDFLKIMESKGYKSKQGKHLAFNHPDKKFFMRTKTLGMNYLENSIKYRIENKDFKIHKYKYTIENEKIDKSDEKFRNNYGLRKWATKKNIAHLQEISDLVINQGMTLEEIEYVTKSEEEFIEGIESSLADKDNLINDLLKKSGSFEIYKNSASLMVALKNSENPKKFKSENYKDIIKHDIAKKHITELRNDYGIESESELSSFINDLTTERNNVFSSYTALQREREKKQEKVKSKEQDINKKKRRSL